jgi:hypothetical protein
MKFRLMETHVSSPKQKSPLELMLDRGRIWRIAPGKDAETLSMKL